MVSPWRYRVLATASRRLGRGLMLSGAIHAMFLVSLTLVVTRPGNQVGGDGLAESAVIVEFASTDFDPNGPAFGPAPPEPQPPASLPTGEATAAAAGPNRVATAALPSPALAPSASPSSSRPAAARRTSRPGGRSGLAVAARTALPAKVDDDPERPVPALPPQPAPQVGPPGPSPRALFLKKLKRHLHEAWRSDEVYLRIDPNGRLRGSMLISALQVRLRADGKIERADLKDSSGIYDLDQEALATIRRIQPLGALPTEMVDAQGGYEVRCSFHLDVGLHRFANNLHHAIAQEWRPSRAFAATAEQERRTMVKLMLSREGALIQADVVSPAGLDFLDKGAVAWVRPGMRFPPPPPAFGSGPGPVPIFVGFLHRAGAVIVIKPQGGSGGGVRPR